MDLADLDAWFDRYLEAVAERGRGDADDMDGLLAYYAVPLLVSAGDASTILASHDPVIGFIRQQIDGLRASPYRGTRLIEREARPLNGVTALYTARLAREHTDGTPPAELTVTYLVSGAGGERRIAALVVHS